MTRLEAIKHAEGLIWAACNEVSEEERLLLSNHLSQMVRDQDVAKFSKWLDEIIQICNELKEYMNKND